MLDFKVFSFPKKIDFVELLFTINEAPALESSNTAPDAGFVEIADKFPPKAPKAPPIDIYLELPLSFSKLHAIASFKLCEFKKNGSKIDKIKILIYYLEPLLDPDDELLLDDELLDDDITGGLE